MNKNGAYQVKANEVVQGKFHGKALSATRMTSDYEPLPPKMEAIENTEPKQMEVPIGTPKTRRIGVSTSRYIITEVVSIVIVSSYSWVVFFCILLMAFNML